MKFILVPDSFKESMSSVEAAEVMKDAVLDVFPGAEIIALPIGDGGEGTMDALLQALGGSQKKVVVTGPLGEPIEAGYAILGDGLTAVVEMAQCSGLHLIPQEQRNPLITTTYGTGELILEALNQPIERLIVTLGGSATNDAGVGMLQALGAEFRDDNKQDIGFGGGCLGQIASVDFSHIDARLSSITILVACDVRNPLIGPRGASQVFAPQKGASESMVVSLEKGLTNFADVIASTLGVTLHDVPSAGAAGGMGAALMLLEGQLSSGIDIVLDTIRFDKHLQGADYVLTGEGRIDDQTPEGKVIAGIVKRARVVSVPVIAFAGAIKPGYEKLYEEGLVSVQGIVPYPCTLEEALMTGKTNLRRAVESTLRVIRIGY